MIAWDRSNGNKLRFWEILNSAAICILSTSAPSLGHAASEVIRSAIRRDAARFCGKLSPGPGPALIEAVVDPNEPPLPPKVSFEQSKNLVEALARGTPDRA